VYLLYILYKKKESKKIMYPTIIFFSLFFVFIYYNYSLVGEFSIAKYPIVEREFKIHDPDAVNFFENLSSIANSYYRNGVKWIPRLIWRYFIPYTCFIIPLLGMFGVLQFKSKWKWVLACNFLLLIFLYNFHSKHGWPQYGARYYYSGFFSVVFFSTVCLKKAIESVDKSGFAFYVLTLIFLVNCVVSFAFMKEFAFRIDIKQNIIRNIQSKCKNGSIVVLHLDKAQLDNGECYHRVPYIDIGSEKRNMFFDQNQLFIENDHPLLDLSKFSSNFPDYTICHYRYEILPELLSVEN
jgi:hypothetical protein